MGGVILAGIIKSINEALAYDIEKIGIDPYWNLGDKSELKMHSIHAYPAKFPAFIATKAIEYARKEGINVNRIADIFCGCGTVALEAKLNNIDFWGCDINPVATLIAKTKSTTYNPNILNKHYISIIKSFHEANVDGIQYDRANERLKYWFDKESYINLYKLLDSIERLPEGKYKQAFKCIFSAILKPTSRWLTKSIKPQVDPDKIPANVLLTFQAHFSKFIKAINENLVDSRTQINITKGNFLYKENIPIINLIVTSPPYVTSYEYADLHQLSSLWLGYTDDFKTLRKGTIGSIHNSEGYCFKSSELNRVGNSIVSDLQKKNIQASKVKSVARYYIDMQKTIAKCYSMLSEDGMVVFVLGDTEYKGVKIENSRHLVETLISSGFKEVRVTKRKISNKLLTPYRDSAGRFTTDKSERKIYHEEFVIIGKKVSL